MTTIYDRETELGRSRQTIAHSWALQPGEECIVYAQTTASLNGSRRLLIIEHRCYVRQGDDLPEQSWVKPAVLIEPATGSRDDLFALAHHCHQQFIERARQQIPEEFQAQSLRA